jgi:hypothetical protein
VEYLDKLVVEPIDDILILSMIGKESYWMVGINVGNF